MRRTALAAAAILTLSLTAFTITVAAQQREAQVALSEEAVAAGARPAGSHNLKSRLHRADAGLFSFPTSTAWQGNEANIRGTLEFPGNATGRVPLVVVVPGADGIDAAEKGWASYWHSQGYATFLLDYVAPRRVGSGSRNIPHAPADVADALKVLATHPRIDTGKVAVQGLSNGAAMTLGSSALLRAQARRIGVQPKAYIMLYGGCQQDLAVGKISDAAYLFLVGDEDTLTPAGRCTATQEAIAEHGRDARTVVLAGAYHGFDGNDYKDFQDRRFGHVIVQPNRAARNEARVEAGALLNRVFAGS